MQQMGAMAQMGMGMGGMGGQQFAQIGAFEEDENPREHFLSQLTAALDNLPAAQGDRVEQILA